jgi:hypothetical protein
LPALTARRGNAERQDTWPGHCPVRPAVAGSRSGPLLAGTRPCTRAMRQAAKGPPSRPRIQPPANEPSSHRMLPVHLPVSLILPRRPLDTSRIAVKTPVTTRSRYGRRLAVVSRARPPASTRSLLRTQSSWICALA